MMNNIAIIGAGVMGRGVAQVFASSNNNIILCDVSDNILNDAKEEIKRNIRFNALFQRERTSNDEEIIERIKFTTDLGEIYGVDYIIENITEDIEQKDSLYREINEICKPDCIILVNTSCISITHIASYMKNPQNIIGAHFMNPVPLIGAVEIIKGFYTSEETIEKTNNLLSSIGKEGILVNDFPGFVSNRISHLMMNEAAFIVQDNVSDAESVDMIFKKCYGHKMGPLETADLIGLDTVVKSLDVLYRSYQDSKYRCCPLLKKMVEAGLLGRKSGKGFYSY